MHPQDCYADILHLPRPAPHARPRMPRQDRAAQFAPFAALVGYGAVIEETGRLTQPQLLLGEDALALLDRKQRLLSERLHQLPEVTVTYFRRDARKAGGAYLTVTGQLRRVDDCEGVLILTGGQRIPLRDICALESPLLQGMPE